jgi:hypothetical protein
MRVALVAMLALLVLAAPARAEKRLDRAADALQSAPLYVHPELEFLVPEADQELIRTALHDAYLPFDVRIAVLPSVESDESGGEADRALWAIDDRLSKSPRLLIGIDQRGHLDVLRARLKRDLDVPFELEYGGEDSAKTIVPRLRGVLQLASTAKTSDYVYQRERPTDPLDPLPEDRPDDYYEDEDDSPWPVLVGAGIGGLLTGAAIWGCVAFGRWARA